MRRFLFICFSLLMFASLSAIDVGKTQCVDPPGCTVMQFTANADIQSPAVFFTFEANQPICEYRYITRIDTPENFTVTKPAAYWNRDYGLYLQVSVTNYYQTIKANCNSLSYMYWDNPTSRHVIFS